MSKMIQVTRSSMPPIDEYIEEIKGLWDTCWLTNMGKKHQQFQKDLQKFLNVEHIELLVNGHMAIEMALQALNLEPWSEVITTPFTFASTTHAIVRNNLKPIFCDIDPVTYTMDVRCLENLINEKTSAIVPVHVYGNICDVEEIDRIAKKHHLKVLYDAAHAFGEFYKGTGIGNFGDVSCFSFHATKVFHSIEGGAACYADNQLGQVLYDLKNFGIHGPEEVVSVGANAKMNEFCAAMGICNLRHLDEEIKKRGNIVARYREQFEGIKGLQMNCVQDDVVSNYAYFPVVFHPEILGFNRNHVYEKLINEGIVARKYFYPLTSTYECYKDQSADNDTPVAKKISERVLTLPLYADLDITDVDRICSTIKALL